PAKIGMGAGTGVGSAGIPLGGAWEFVGPKNLDVPYQIYYGVRPTSGRVNALAYDPKSSSTVYLGGANGGLWRTKDAGLTWTALSDKWNFLFVSSIAVHPTNSNTIYVGTGDWHGGGGYGMGIMKTTDGGVTWTNLGANQFSNYAVSRVLIDPDNPDTIVVTTGRGRDYNGQVFRSADAGASWSPVITTPAAWSDAAISAKTAAGIRYFYAVGSGGNVYRSDNRGVTWTKLSPSIGAGGGTVGIAASLTNPENAYLLSTDDQKIFKTTDHGGSWTDTTANFPGGYNWSQGWYDFHITCGAGGSNDNVYVGLIDIIRSSDSGANWRSIAGTYTPGAISHNDQHCMAINPSNPNEAMFGNDGGVYKLVSSATGETITPLSKTLGISQFYNADWHPTNPTIMIGGTQDNATPVSSGDLANWRNVGGGDGGWSLINPLKPSTQYATSQFLGMYRTDNSWANTDYISPDTGSDYVAFIPTIAIDPTKPDNVYAATNYLWRYNAATRTWSPRLGGTRLSATSVVISIAVAHNNSSVIYTGSADGNLYMTSNGGGTWKRLNGVPNRAITGISIDPANPNSIIISLSGTGTGHVYECKNTVAATPAFVNRSGAAGVPDIPANCIERDPGRPDTTWFVGTDIGVFATTDGGSTWGNATAPLGLPNVQVSSLKALPGTAYLNAATFGRGMWRIKLGTEATLVPTSFALHYGSMIQGDIGALAKADGVTMNIRSANQAGIGQTAGIQATFKSTVARADLLGIDVVVRSSGASISTEQIFAYNVVKAEWVVLQNSSATGSMRNLRFTLSGDPRDFLSSTGTIQLVVRTIKPARLGTTAITYKLDVVNVITRSSK
ncbi:MAG TPA: hypothetical protein VK934_07890, partial [Fimbriimonas sp.]|nr:hypothetical protein [Fimbriimonas sp.]